MNILADRPHAYIFFLLIRHLSLTTEKPPKTTTSPASPKLDPQCLELLHLRFNCALTDRAIARKMEISDRFLYHCFRDRAIALFSIYWDFLLIHDYATVKFPEKNCDRRYHQDRVV